MRRTRLRLALGMGLVSAVYFSTQTWAALVPPQAEGHRIRVRIAEAVASVQIRAYDLSIYDSRIEPQLSTANQAAWDFRCEGDRVRAISAEGGQTLNLKGPLTLVSRSGMITVGGHSYREQIRIYGVGSLCEVVNDLDIEKYLVGLVNAEFNSHWNEQALEAQIVAARTYALYQVRQAHGAPFDVDATVKDQVYDGFAKEDFRAARAVERTRGLVLTASAQGLRPEPIKAFYHSTCGGRTELPQNVWGGAFPGFKHEVSCPFCHGSPAYYWHADLGAREIVEALGRGLRNDGVPRGWPKGIAQRLRAGELHEIRVGAQDASGRLADVVLVVGGDELLLSAARFRDWVGPARVKSTAFSVERVGTSWRLAGRGNGHGVGMCQWGAKGMGEKGYATAQILQHYYPDAVLRRLW